MKVSVNNCLINTLVTSFTKRFRALFIFLLLLEIHQNIILAVPVHTNPRVIVFSKNNYSASRQNWNVSQDNNGIMYFANNDGLLQYDGSNWELYRMPGNMVVRSVAVDKKNRIYTGSFEEFGYWDSRPDGSLEYHSLSAKLKDYKFNNEEVWRIIIVGDKVYFQSFGVYFVFDGNTVRAIHPPENILFFIQAGDMVLAQGLQKGLFRLQNDSLVLIPNSQLFKGALIHTAMQLDSNRVLLGTASRGLYIFYLNTNKFETWKTEADDILINGQINCGIIADDSTIYIGTIGAGIVAMDAQGRLLWHFHKDFTLSTNTILYLYKDLSGNTWAALDKGIALILHQSPFQFITSDIRNVELAYKAVEFENTLYIGTNQGVFRMEDEGHRNSYRLIQGTQGQIWQLQVFGNQLICGHNEGTFRIENGKLFKISTSTGYSGLRPIYLKGQEYLIQGTYSSLAIYKKDISGGWQFSHLIEGFSNPIPYLEVDHLGNVWVSHNQRGLFRIRLNADLTKVLEIKSFGSNSGLPGDQKINVFKFEGRIVFCTGEQVYTYDDLKEQIVPFYWFNNQVGAFKASWIILPTNNGKYWLVMNGKFALVDIVSGKLNIVHIIPFSILNNDLINDNEFITLLNDGRYLFCLDNGLALFNPDYNSQRHSKAKVLLREARASSNKTSLLLPLITDEKNLAIIPYTNRRLLFRFAYPDFSFDDIHFFTTIKRTNEQTADTIWQQLSISEFFEVGQYKLSFFTVDAKGKGIDTYEYFIKVQPPFYRSRTAYLIYFSLFLVTCYIGWLAFRLHMAKQKEKVRVEQEKLQKERIERREQKIIMLKNDKLQAELVHKSKELASSTMSIIRKNEMLIQLKQEVESHKNKLGNQYPNKYYERLIRLINENISSDGDWEIFQQNFDMIHENFFQHIKNKYPSITAHDLKLCAYIRLNLSTKEIASLLNISIRGVEAARYRLRKKLSLQEEKNLTDFFIEFK